MSACLAIKKQNKTTKKKKKSVIMFILPLLFSFSVWLTLKRSLIVKRFVLFVLFFYFIFFSYSSDYIVKVFDIKCHLCAFSLTLQLSVLRLLDSTECHFFFFFVRLAFDRCQFSSHTCSYHWKVAVWNDWFSSNNFNNTHVM